MDKQSIRHMMKEKRLQMKNETFLIHSNKIHEQFLQHPLYHRTHMIGIYVNLPQEVETLSLIERMLQDHRVCVPKVQGETMDFYEIHSLDDLKEGHFHVLEPISDIYVKPQDIDLMIIPMLAFDLRLYRVGYGKGYYDRYLTSGFQGYKIGFAFSWQEVEKIDNDDYDQVLDEVITS